MKKKKITPRLSPRNYSTKLRKCKNMIRKAKVRHEKKIAREAKINNKTLFRVQKEREVSGRVNGASKSWAR